uniref:Uncharacterized protein n=1 Tax=Knipowitschia caucasica TaxID=637954 RepID=A0AAV2J133_KNICA
MFRRYTSHKCQSQCVAELLPASPPVVTGAILGSPEFKFVAPLGSIFVLCQKTSADVEHGISEGGEEAISEPSPVCPRAKRGNSPPRFVL